jgi:site-specific DNA-methyltransferase (adenine-specific)
MSEIHLLQGDCLEILPTLPDMSVDAIITDVPYGTTACKWDVIIPLDKMWEQVKRLCKGAFVTTASQPFTSVLIMSNLDWFRQELIWDKVLPVGHLDANRRHLRRHENILLFSAAGYPTYNPQKTVRGKPRWKGGTQEFQAGETVYHSYTQIKTFNNEYYPTSLVQVSNGDRTRPEVGFHPTQKPVALYEYLIKTYTNPGDTVLDFCAGSGTTIVAAIKTGRNVIGIEKEREYFEIMERRATDAQPQMVMPL